MQARYQPAALAICMPGAAQPYVSYGRLATMINGIARRARAVGLSPGDTIAIYADDPVLHLVLTLGLTCYGAITVSGGVSAIAFNCSAVSAPR